jgi:hypothetical protein
MAWDVMGWCGVGWAGVVWGGVGWGGWRGVGWGGVGPGFRNLAEGCVNKTILFLRGFLNLRGFYGDLMDRR